MVLALTGLGMVSSLGWDVVASCAAIRAGLSRPRPQPDAYVTDEDLLEPVPVVGHPVSGLTDGFGPMGRWHQLAVACFEDLRGEAALPPPSDTRFWQQTGLLYVLPHLDPERYLEVREVGAEQVTEAWLERWLHSQGLTVRTPRSQFIHAGHAGTALALQISEQWLAARDVERVVILAVDSYLDEMSLEWLLNHRRVKSPDRPVGLMPGEAGACLLVESLSAARQRGVPVLGVVAAVATGREVGSLLVGQRPRGDALAQVIVDVLTEDTPPERIGDVVADLNGEEWRAAAWGFARVRVGSRLDDDVRLLLPCIALGDTGAASGAVGVCVAARAFARKYARGAGALVVSSAEHGDVGAIQVMDVSRRHG